MHSKTENNTKKRRWLQKIMVQDHGKKNRIMKPKCASFKTVVDKEPEYLRQGAIVEG